jgi:branched-chain amino acid transport system ATP-binding protein
MSFLEISGIDAHYGLFQALRSVSLKAEAGETLAIVGANGAGKTTLMRAICGALNVSRGTITMNGSAVHGRPAYELNALGIAMVPEGRRIFPSLSVEENLQLGGYGGRKGHWNLDRIYGLFPELVKRRGNAGLDLSGGEQQMVAIGRALMSNPALILMDEISLGLAPIVVNQIYGALSDIVGQGTTVLLVEQDVSRALAVASTVYCLLEGRVSLTGQPADLTEAQIMKAYFGV